MGDVDRRAGLASESSAAPGSSSAVTADSFAGTSVAGFSAAGFSAAGLSVAGFSVAGFSVAGFSAAGFSAAGFSAAGFSAAGFSAAGFSAAGFSATGFSVAGFSAAGFSAAGVSADAPFVCGESATLKSPAGVTRSRLPPAVNGEAEAVVRRSWLLLAGGRCRVGREGTSLLSVRGSSGRLSISSERSISSKRCSGTNDGTRRSRMGLESEGMTTRMGFELVAPQIFCSISINSMGSRPPSGIDRTLPPCPAPPPALGSICVRTSLICVTCSDVPFTNSPLPVGSGRMVGALVPSAKNSDWSVDVAV